MKKLTITLVAIGILTTFSCGNDTKKTTSEPEIITIDTSEKEAYVAATTEVTFNDSKVAEAYQNYIDLKTALVNTDATTTATKASQLLKSFENAGVTGEAVLAAQAIAESQDIEVQRTSFVTVTTGVEKMLEGAIESGVIYKQYCPMAFDFAGGFWLSNSKEIHNPFFGDKMLRCGKVTSEIK